MSWNASFVKPVEKSRVEHSIDTLDVSQPIDPPAWDQFQAAKRAARSLAQFLPGPYLMVALSGHANGVGWQKKAGFANDCISVVVTQHCEEDLQYYQK